MPKIIQFLHTAVEAKPKDNSYSVIPWNNNDTHRRKFLVSRGKYIGNEGKEIESNLVFWGEWEAQSDIVKISKGNKMPPRYLNTPFINPSVSKRTHNTDPYVFGKRFKYIVCKQTFYHNLLVNMEPKSIILFGSSINGNFCLDTVFVVSDIQNSYNLMTIENLFPKEKRGQYYHASVNPIYDDTNYNKNIDKEDSCRISEQTDYTYYESVAFNDKEKYNGIYSFVPSKLYSSKSSANYIFRQPILNLDFIKGKQTQGLNSKDCSDLEIENYWKEIVSQVEHNGLKKGIFFNTPERRNNKNPLKTTHN